ncbi:hypothetical protein BSKO_05358 [Bryopsis sp. KO-2023]|nr:hypothetical protein BSKO_05358 [Bryopsis sp. KO-2023]
MRWTALTIFLLFALCWWQRAEARRLDSGGGRELKILGWLFGDDDDEEVAEQESSEIGSAISSSTSSVSISSSSKDDPCGKTQSYSESTGGGVATSTGTVSSDECETSSDASAISKGKETVVASAKSEAEKGKIAKAIAKAVGSGDGVDVVSEAIARAIEEGDGDAVAIAIADSLEQPCPRGTKRGECPVEVNIDALVKAFALAENEGAGLAFAEAIVLGVLDDDSKVQSTYAGAISKILKEEGCEVAKPVLSEALAVATRGDDQKEFLDVDVKIAECLFETCKGDALECCQGKSCEFDSWMSGRNEIWELEDGEMCVCPGGF